MLNRKEIIEAMKNGLISVCDLNNTKKNYIDNSNLVEDNYVFVTLNNVLKVYNNDILDVKNANEYEQITIPEEGFLLEPNKLYLGATNEYTKTYEHVPMLSGLSELAALGIEIHVTAGFGDNGFEGTWTLEIVCTNPTILYPNMPIGKLYYHPVVGDSSIVYRGKYFDQTVAGESKLSNEYTRVRGDK